MPMTSNTPSVFPPISITPHPQLESSKYPSKLKHISSWVPCQPPKIQAHRPVDKFGPVPEGVLCPKVQAPDGSRYCEEVHAFVPDGLPYRIRAIEGANLSKQRPKGRFFPGSSKRGSGGLTMAMGLTHAKLNLIPLGEAQKRGEIVYHSVDTLDAGDLLNRRFGTNLISLREARQNPDIKYRTVL